MGFKLVKGMREKAEVVPPGVSTVVGVPPLPALALSALPALVLLPAPQMGQALTRGFPPAIPSARNALLLPLPLPQLPLGLRNSYSALGCQLQGHFPREASLTPSR